MNLRPDLELAIRELYGYSVIFGVGVLVLIALSRFKRLVLPDSCRCLPCWRGILSGRSKFFNFSLDSYPTAYIIFAGE